MKVGFLTADWAPSWPDRNGFPTLGGAGWYRCGLPAEYLRRNGFEVVVAQMPVQGESGELALRGWSGEVHTGLDVVVLQRWMHQDAPEVIRRARACGQVIVQDVDDWYGGLPPTNRAFLESHPRAGWGLNRREARRLGFSQVTPINVNHYWEAMGASSMLIVSTPFLKERLERQVPVFVVRNAIDLERWEPAAKSRSDDPMFGWVGSTSHRSSDLEVLRGVVGPFLESRGLRFHHAGHLGQNCKAAEGLGIGPGVVSTEPQCSIEDYPQMFDQIDVSVVPLSSRPFNSAKSAIKGMESVAAGCVFVASASPEYRWLAETHGIGRVAATPMEWKRHLGALLDPEVRAVEAKRQREALSNLDMSVRWVDWLRVLMEAYALV